MIDEDDYEEPVKPESCYVDGVPRVLSRQCSTCIGRPGNKMHLSPGRVKGMVQAASREGSQGIICHQTLSYSSDMGGALCRWYFETYGHLNGFIRIIERIGKGFTEVDPPEEKT